MTPKILVLGKSGQVGQALVSLLGTRALALGEGEIDFLAADFIIKLERWIAEQSLSAVINAAAYTQVDKAEGEGRSAAIRINGTAVEELAAWCDKQGLPLVHYSTDYVFSGDGDTARHEDDKPSPVNAYGESKLRGEQAIMEQGGKYLIFRTSWIYDAYGKNFFNTVIRLLREKDSINVVADQVGAPTYALHLAQATLEALAHAESVHAFPSGLYHLCAAGETSWHGFAEMIFTLARRHDSSIRCRQVNPIPTSDYPLPARRPLNSRLDCSRARRLLGVALPHWEAGVKECIEEKYAGSRLPDNGT